MYDISRDRWFSISSMTATRSNTSLAVANEKVYAVGGDLNGEFLKSAEVFEFPAKAWRSIGELQFARKAPGIAAVRSVIYVTGGESENSTERYDAEEDQWRMAAPLNTNRHSFGMATLGDCIYAVGGYTDPADPNSAIASIE